VRVAANEAYQICFALDAGARGIGECPLVC